MEATEAATSFFFFFQTFPRLACSFSLSTSKKPAKPSAHNPAFCLTLLQSCQLAGACTLLLYLLVCVVKESPRSFGENCCLFFCQSRSVKLSSPFAPVIQFNPVQVKLNSITYAPLPTAAAIRLLLTLIAVCRFVVTSHLHITQIVCRRYNHHFLHTCQLFIKVVPTSSTLCPLH